MYDLRAPRSADGRARESRRGAITPSEPRKSYIVNRWARETARSESPGSWPAPPLAVSRVERVASEQLLDAQQLVVFGGAVAAAQRTGLDLAAIGSNGEVGDGRILSLSGAMTEHGGVPVFLVQFDGIERLREGTDLVVFDENRVGGAGVDAFLEKF